MKIEQKIKEVQKYFIDKILNQDFEIDKENCSVFDYIMLIIDKKYKFELIINNQQKIVYQLWWYFKDNVLDLELSDEVQKELYKIFENEINLSLAKRAEKMAQYEKLKKELNL